jgi:hypothetical protein
MKTTDERSTEVASTSRRELLVAVAAGTGLAMLPGAQALAAIAPTGFAPSIGMGYCRPSAGADATLSDALSVTPTRGTYELRVVGAATNAPMAIGARYANNAEHYFWQAWMVQNLLQRSPQSAIRWAANAGNALPLTIDLSKGGSGATQVPAQAGVYALIIVPQLLKMPAWNSLALRNSTTGGVSMRLVTRSTGAEVNFQYALFSVRALYAASIKA